MKNLRVILVANRGEIACRLLRAASKLGLRTIAIYTEPDAESQHVRTADEACLLRGEPRSAYIDGNQIIEIAKERNAQAIIPGYGFLSENTDFARSIADAGLIFVGPSPEAIESFGLKHTARELAIAARVPVVPGSQGLLETEEAAVKTAANMGYPVMLKATAGGGGMGLLTCADEEEVRRNFATVRSRGASLFKNSGLFLEKYFPNSHHIEVQVFGNGEGTAISIGERECSIQRRHQKVIEECPSPFIEQKHPELRQKLTEASIRLAESIKYGSAGTIEFLVDDASGEFFFLEMNTRLQVEHGITEMCYDIDLVELMLLQADHMMEGHGIPMAQLKARQQNCLGPRGHAIEARVYAENPARNFVPSPGLLQQVSWYDPPGTRIDTWIRAGITISPDYDPLLAKVMFHGSTRQKAIEGITQVLNKSVISGPPVNIGFLLAIVNDERFNKGNTITKFLDALDYAPAAIDVISGGSYTLVEDFPGRPSVGHGFGHAGPMDPIAFQAANILVGNPGGTEGLEITLTGPELLFLSDAIIAICGPPIPASLDGQDLTLWTRRVVRPGQTLKIGKLAANCRTYLAIYGGLPGISEWFGSKSTNPLVGVGGYQGRPLRAGDFLRIVEPSALPKVNREPVTIPQQLQPRYTSDWHIQVMSGPYETGYLSPEDIDKFFSTTWKVSHNAARGGIRLIGPRPKFARSDGGDGGTHPSNVFEYGYPIGGLNWTGDEPVLFPIDCPDFGGFICSMTFIKADTWKVGQLRAGDTIRFHRVSLESALASRRKNEAFLQRLASSVQSGSWASAIPFDSETLGPDVSQPGQDILAALEARNTRPEVTYRGGADDYLLVEYGDGRADLNHKCRAVALKKEIAEATGIVSVSKNGGAIYNMVACGNTVALWYDGMSLPRETLVNRLLELENSLGDLREFKFPNRHIRLPVTFRHKKLEETTDRYMANQRSIASYLPDPFKYVAETNGMTSKDLKDLFLSVQSVVIAVGFIMALPECLPADPRHRIRTPKMNPSRTFTPAGCFGWGGSAIVIYQVDSPGGYMPTGMTIPGLDIYGSRPGFTEEKPWLFEDMDVVTYHEVSEDEYDTMMADFKSGKYQFQIKDGVFDMALHNQLLRETADETRELQKKRAIAQQKMAEKEQTLLEEWIVQKEAGVPSTDEIQHLLQDPTVQVIESPTNANVWKVMVQEGERLKAGQVLVVLEAMKMEISVTVSPQHVNEIVAKVTCKSGDGVESGQPLVLVKRKDT